MGNPVWKRWIIHAQTSYKKFQTNLFDDFCDCRTVDDGPARPSQQELVREQKNKTTIRFSLGSAFWET